MMIDCVCDCLTGCFLPRKRERHPEFPLACVQIEALSNEYRAYNCRFVAALVVLALSALLVPLEQSQAQLYIDVYQSRDNTNQTLWGSSPAQQPPANFGAPQ